MWLDNIDVGGRGIVQPAKGPLRRALRAARHDLVLSQQRPAELAGVSQAAVSRLERGAPSWSLFCQLLDAIGSRPSVTVERLLTKQEAFDAFMRGEGGEPEEEDAGHGWW